MEPVLLPTTIEKFLKAFLKEIGMKDYTTIISSATRPGENFSGIVNRITINDRNQKSGANILNLIIKIAPNNESLRLAFPLRALFEREIYYYTKVFPEFERLQKEQKTLNSLTVFPKLYKTSLQNLNEALLLEDMNVLGYQRYEALKTLDYDHALFVIKEYGKLHALSFVLRYLKPDVFNKLESGTYDHILRGFPITEARQNGYKLRNDQVLACLDVEEDKSAYELYKKFSSKMLDTVEDVVQTEKAGKYGVLTHGDCWINNYLFKYEDSSTPSSMCILDWQAARCGSPALDLSYFLFCCISHSLRKEHYWDLIKEYYKSFSTFLKTFGLVSEEVFPFSVLKDHLKRFSTYGLFMAVITLTFTLLQGKGGPSFQTAKNEVEMFSLRKAHNSEDHELYRSRMRGVVVDFVNFGFEI
ncbi:hypothetical protein RI129_002588 [Pyrocoelia pectoralis]|uniref:CHK kinase-like domain-containing protein n=1 Tax=Pyrocoelia pectoralis TaxID=417401 RepID=A0AAN7VLW0_9COLE